MYVNSTIKRIKDRGLVFLFTLLMMLRFIGGIPVPAYLLINIVIFLCLWHLISKKVRLYLPILVLLCYIPISIMIANPDPVFHSWERFLLFVSLLLLVSPLLQNNRFRCFRIQCLYLVFIFSIIITVLSFFAYFLGINLMRSENVDTTVFYNTAGLFGGLTKHSMLLGPLSAVSIISLLYFFYVTRKKYILLIVVPCVGCLLFAASRGSIIAVIVGIAFLLYNLSVKKSLFLKRVLLITLGLIVTFPLWQDATIGIKEKNNRDDQGIFDSRTYKIQARIKEFRQKPIFGIGFAAVDPNGGDSYNVETGTIEPGSSWLAVLSMLGILGFLQIFYLIYDSFNSLSKGYYRQRNALIISIMSFFIVHMFIEGYIFASGSPLCFIFWLIIGVSIDYKYSINQIGCINYC